MTVRVFDYRLMKTFEGGDEAAFSLNPRHWMELSYELHVAAALPGRYETGWAPATAGIAFVCDL